MKELAITSTKTIVPAMMKKFGFTNALQVPRITKITVHVGVGKNMREDQNIAIAEENLMRITGQKPARTKAKKSIASFKVREGMVVGVRVTLRKKRMADFLEKLLTFVFPRTRDFRGIDERCVDKQGNLNVGFKETVAFPEIKSDEIERIHGLEVNITTNANDHAAGLELFRLYGFPFKQKLKKS